MNDMRLLKLNLIRQTSSSMSTTVLAAILGCIFPSFVLRLNILHIWSALPLRKTKKGYVARPVRSMSKRRVHEDGFGHISAIKNITGFIPKRQILCPVTRLPGPVPFTPK